MSPEPPIRARSPLQPPKFDDFVLPLEVSSSPTPDPFPCLFSPLRFGEGTPRQVHTRELSLERILRPPSPGETPAEFANWVTIDARNTRITVRRYELPPCLMARLNYAPSLPGSMPTLDVNIEASVMHRVLDYHRDGKLPTTLSEHDTQALKAAGKWLGDQHLLDEVRLLLPLRREVKANKNTSHYAFSLLRLADALESVQEYQRAHSKREKAEQVSIEQNHSAYAPLLSPAPPELFSNAMQPHTQMEMSQSFPFATLPPDEAQRLVAPLAVPLPDATWEHLRPHPSRASSDVSSSLHSLSTAMDFATMQSSEENKAEGHEFSVLSPPLLYSQSL